MHEPKMMESSDPELVKQLKTLMREQKIYQQTLPGSLCCGAEEREPVEPPGPPGTLQREKILLFLLQKPLKR